MAFFPPVELPNLSDLCPHWLDAVFRRHENIVDEESALAASEAELTQRSKSIAHQYSDITPLGRLNDGGDNMEEHEEEEEEEEGDPGDEEYESGGEGDMDDMDADDYYLDDGGTTGIDTSAASPATVSATITLPLPVVTTAISGNATSQQQSATTSNNATTSGNDQDPILIEDAPVDNQS